MLQLNLYNLNSLITQIYIGSLEKALSQVEKIYDR